MNLKILPLLWFKLQISGVGSDRSANRATACTFPFSDARRLCGKELRNLKIDACLLSFSGWLVDTRLTREELFVSQVIPGPIKQITCAGLCICFKIIQIIRNC